MNRYNSTKKVGILGIVGNLFLLIIKIGVALISNSQAILADALNSAGDIFSSLMTTIGNKIASVPHDEDHNFGHGKAEYIFSLLISIFMILIACKILIDSVASIITKQEFTFSWFLVLVCLITITTKLLLYLYCKKLYKKHQNILIKASMKDHRNDMLLTIGTLIAVILGKYGFYYFDGLLGSIISTYIMFSGIGIFLESYKVLMDVSIAGEEKRRIIMEILKNKDIRDVRDFYTVATGYKYIAILTIDVDGNLNTFTSHEIADNLEKTIQKKFRKIYQVIVHVNPINIDEDNNKERLRKEYKKTRDSILDRDKKAQEIASKFLRLDEYKKSKVIALYSPINSEVDTTYLANICLKDKKEIVYPKVINKKEMAFLKVKSLKDLKEGTFSILEPTNIEDIISKNEIDIMIIPGLCFDKNKNRVGYGKGYYDNYLKDTNCTKVSFCFEQQITKNQINANNLDIKMDYLITEKEIY